MSASRQLALFALVAAVTATASTARAQGLRRFAIVAGNDAGGSDTKSLLRRRGRARVHGILRLGGAAPDATLLIGASASQLLSDRRRRDAGRRGGRRREHTALFFYYSGHAKDGSLAGRDAHSVDGIRRASRPLSSTCASQSWIHVKSGAFTH